MAKPERVLLQPRMAAPDAKYIVDRAEVEGRSLGEQFALVIRENRLMRALLKVEAPEAEVQS